MGTLSWDQFCIWLILPAICGKGSPLFFVIGKRMKSLLAYLRSVLTFIAQGNLQASICSLWDIDVLLSSLTNRNKDCVWKGSSLYCKQPVFPYVLSGYNAGTQH